MAQRNPIMDSVEYLTSLPEEELREVLIEDKYNKANLREIIRQLIKTNQNLQKVYDYQREVCVETEEELVQLKQRIIKIAKEG